MASYVTVRVAKSWLWMVRTSSQNAVIICRTVETSELVWNNFGFMLIDFGWSTVCNWNMKWEERWWKRLLITFYTFREIIVLDISEAQNCRQEDVFTWRINPRAFRLHCLKMIISHTCQMPFILFKACFLFLTSLCYSTGTAILIDLLDWGIASSAASRTMVSKRQYTSSESDN